MRNSSQIGHKKRDSLYIDLKHNNERGARHRSLIDGELTNQLGYASLFGLSYNTRILANSFIDRWSETNGGYRF